MDMDDEFERTKREMQAIIDEVSNTKIQSFRRDTTDSPSLVQLVTEVFDKMEKDYDTVKNNLDVVVKERENLEKKNTKISKEIDREEGDLNLLEETRNELKKLTELLKS
ncbi:hypothetical protein GCK72_011742 [Caenorhabditis remanei]|uniref:Uncharacterized protein n=1 Tax=Caenorhabditis remanei TaxID=31234 RepID=A0A2P4VYH4_CAERE|nr:hypothetical protein GCK72_011742 [Caenorhabditis remanei]KAF1763476.1 hypothetical protein GCK72_011742 [Caenorhabditis remanei]